MASGRGPSMNNPGTWGRIPDSRSSCFDFLFRPAESCGTPSDLKRGIPTSRMIRLFLVLISMQLPPISCVPRWTVNCMVLSNLSEVVGEFEFRNSIPEKKARQATLWQRVRPPRHPSSNDRRLGVSSRQRRLHLNW